MQRLSTCLWFDTLAEQAASQRAFDAMRGTTKLDIDGLEAACAGN